MITFYLNGELTEYTGDMSARLLDVLRGEYKLMGTKCGCLEGECGACSVIINGELRNSCLVAMGSLEGADVVTIEGYSKTERFAVLDEAYESVSAVQCGFCIPGMILASECLLAKNPRPTEEEIREAISGNLCRCTGYNAIVKAIGIASDKPAASAAASVSYTLTTAQSLCAEKIIPYKGSSDTSLGRALCLLKDNPQLVPYCGGTDLMVGENLRDRDYLFFGNIPELKQITEDDNYIRFGAACTFAQAIEHPLTPDILKDMCKQIAAPAVRNAGTLGGNIANGSAKADSALVFAVTDSMLRIVSADSERIAAIDGFYLGGGKVDLKPGELISEILMPKFGLDNYYLKKVGARNALAISRVSFAGIMDIQDGIIRNCAVAFGAVIDTIIRYKHIDQMLIGKTVDEAKALRDSYLSEYEKAITPRRGRVGVEYRKDVCMNLLKDFIESSLSS